jgi:hypothetical protein
MSKLRRFLVFLALAFSFGGFTFYAAVVVPIGGAVLGTTTQGFVTRHVTDVINAATAVSIAFLAWEAIAGSASRSRAVSIVLAALIATVAACCLVLVGLHPRLVALLDVKEMSVIDHDEFYRTHRVYLWVSALQWLATLQIVWILVSDLGKGDAAAAQ